MDPRFGRATYFIVVDTQRMDFSILDNSAARNLGHGAGTQAAEAVARAGAEVVISGVLGPQALQVLEARGITVVQDTVDTVAEAVEAYPFGRLSVSPGTSPTAMPRIGRGMGRGSMIGGGKGEWGISWAASLLTPTWMHRSGWDPMKIAIASEKEGTGKTMVAASLAAVWPRPVLAVDLDVKRSIEWIIRRIIKAASRISYHGRRWWVHVPSSFPRAHH